MGSTSLTGVNQWMAVMAEHMAQVCRDGNNDGNGHDHDDDSDEAKNLKHIRRTRGCTTGLISPSLDLSLGLVSREHNFLIIGKIWSFFGFMPLGAQQTDIMKLFVQTKCICESILMEVCTDKAPHSQSSLPRATTGNSSLPIVALHSFPSYLGHSFWQLTRSIEVIWATWVKKHRIDRFLPSQV